LLIQKIFVMAIYLVSPKIVGAALSSPQYCGDGLESRPGKSIISNDGPFCFLLVPDYVEKGSFDGIHISLNHILL
jgi:hypothetical protein